MTLEDEVIALLTQHTSETTDNFYWDSRWEGGVLCIAPNMAEGRKAYGRYRLDVSGFLLALFETHEVTWELCNYGFARLMVSGKSRLTQPPGTPFTGKALPPLSIQTTSFA